MKRSRNQKIDHLRALAILCIILAHTGLQGILFNLRCFDVPLMAFCLAISYYYSSKNLSYISYVKKRFTRLIVPTYIFLALLFTSLFFIAQITDTPYQFNIFYILHAFFMDTGYGYAWIMRTFFLVSLLMPFLYKLSKKYQHFVEILGIFTLLLILQIFLVYLIPYVPSSWQILYTQLVPLAFGYCPIALPGLLVFQLDRKKLLHLSIVILCYLSISFYLYGLHGLTYFKYPPQLPFILYGCFCGCFLWYMLAKYEGNFFAPFSNYLSLHSQELYFIHIFYIYIYEFYLPKEGSLLNNWFFNFIYLLSMSLLTLFLINQGKKKIKQIKNKTRQVECDE